MTEHDAFLRAICTDPDDDTPRLIYADWLEERGDPRGEFIRCQIEVERWVVQGTAVQGGSAGAALARSQQLFDAHRAAWGAALPGPLADATNDLFYWRRGLVWLCQCSAKQLVRRAAEVFTAAPVTEVRLLDREPDDWQDSWCWYKAGNPVIGNGSADISRKLWPPWLGIDQVLRRFDTHERALAALSAWAVDLGRRTVGLPRFQQECPDCGGKGWRSADGLQPWSCLRCQASGWIEPD